MKVLKIIGIILIAFVLITFVWVMTWPNEAHLERSITINAPVEKVFGVVNDFSQTKEWNPWMKIDPEAQYKYSKNTVGQGAYYTWTSEHEQVGNGRQDLLDSKENEIVKTQMAFEGMTGTYTADFILEADGDKTNLKWTFDGQSDALMEKFFLDNTEKFLAPSYEQGLADLKTYIEGLPDPAPIVEEVIEVDSTSEESIIEN